MKTLKKLSLVVAITFATVLSSCSNDSSGGGGISVPATGTYINAKVEGSDFTTVFSGQSTGVASKSGTGAQTPRDIRVFPRPEA